MFKKKLFILYIIFMLSFSFIPLLNDDLIVKSDSISDSSIDWNDVFLKLKENTKIDIKNGLNANFTKICNTNSDIVYTEKSEPNKKKFSIDFNSIEKGYYKIKMTIMYKMVTNISLNERDHLVRIYLEDYVIYFNYSDIVSIPGIRITHLDEMYYSLVIELKDVESSKLISLDPEYIIIRKSHASDYLPYDALHWQNSRRIARVSNGTYYMAYCNGSFAANEYIFIKRSFDDGVTWNNWTKISERGGYLPSLIPDTHNNLHLLYYDLGGGAAWFKTYNASNGTWTGVSHYVSWIKYKTYSTTLDIDKENRLWGAWFQVISPTEYRAMGAYSDDLGLTWCKPFNISTEDGGNYKQSQGMYSFFSNGDGVYAWCGYHSGSVGIYSIRMRRYFYANDTWSTKVINVSAPLGYGTDMYFPAVASDSNENIHISWFDNTLMLLYYRQYCAVNSSFSGVNRVYESGYNHHGCYPSISIDNNDIIYILAQNNKSAVGGVAGSYMTKNLSYWYAQYPALTWQYTKITTWNGSGGRIYKDPVSFYSRYPENATTGLGFNRPAFGVTFCYMDYYYLKNYDTDGQPTESNQATIFFVTENVSWGPGYTINPQGVGTNNATLRGKLFTGATYNAGFWIRANAAPTDKDFDYNFTAGTGYNYLTKPNVWYNISGLATGTYYYVRMWCYDGHLAFNNSYMLTKPNSATSLQLIDLSSSSAHLKWINPTVPNGTLYAVCRYSASSYPISPIAGSAGFNTTQTPATYGHGNVTGLSPGTTYYFSVFSYLEDSGSPLLHSFAGTYAGIVGNTSGGIYNLTFLREHFITDTIFNHADQSTIHGLFVYYENKTEYNYFDWDDNYKQTQGIYGKRNSDTQYILLNCTQTPLSFRFVWNNSGNLPLNRTYVCDRTLIPANNNKNLTFHVCIDRSVYGESTAFWNGSLVPYTISITDYSGYFLTEPGFTSYLYIYTYNETGHTQYIDMEYIDSYNRVYPWLEYGTKYYWGIGNENLVLHQVGIVPTSEYTQNINLIVRYTPLTYDVDYTIHTGRINPHKDGVWLLFDSDEPDIMDSVDVRIYDSTNLSLVYSGNSAVSTVNFSYTGGLANKTYYYIFRHNGTETRYTFIVSGFIYIENQSIVWNGTKINNIFNFLLGLTIFRNPETGKEVSWIMAIIFCVFLIIMLAGKSAEAEIKTLIGASGLWFIFAGIIFISAVSAAVLPLGILFLFIAFIHKKEPAFT